MQTRYRKLDGRPGATRPTDAVGKTAFDTARTADVRWDAFVAPADGTGARDGRSAPHAVRNARAIELSAFHRCRSRPDRFEQARLSHRDRRRSRNAPLSTSEPARDTFRSQAQQLGVHPSKQPPVETTGHRLATGCPHHDSRGRAEREGAGRIRRRPRRDSSVGCSVRRARASSIITCREGARVGARRGRACFRGA